MARDPDIHTFNNDLLVNDGDRTLAESAYPRLIHVLDYPALQHLFTSYDAPANAAKKRSRYSGLVAIVLGTLALLGASAESLSHHPDRFSTMLGIASAIAGIVSVVIG